MRLVWALIPVFLMVSVIGIVGIQESFADKDTHLSEDYSLGEIQWYEASYPLGGHGTLRIIDPDMNINQKYEDIFRIKVWSESDPRGTMISVTETDKSSGIFEGSVLFITEYTHSENIIYVTNNDIVTASYTDTTLPAIHSETELEVTTSTITGTFNFRGYSSVIANNLRIHDLSGNVIDHLEINQQGMISTNIENAKDETQPFAYLVQIQDSNGVTVSLAWIIGSLSANQSLQTELAWTPTKRGSYTTTAFVWESVDNPTALSAPVSTTVNVR